jgi:DNA-binding CsgD family transcriptional regulator
MSGSHHSHLVRFEVSSDDDSVRVAAILEALGYTAKRVGSLGEPDHVTRAERMARRYKLTAREAEILHLFVAGKSGEEIGAALDISRATVKWHRHNIFAKTGVANELHLMRLALGGAA